MLVLGEWFLSGRPCNHCFPQHTFHCTYLYKHSYKDCDRRVLHQIVLRLPCAFSIQNGASNGIIRG